MSATLAASAQQLAQSLSPRDPLANLEALERAAANNWHLSTSQVRELIGTVPSGEKFDRYGFIFWKAGRNGKERAWKIGRV